MRFLFIDSSVNNYQSFVKTAKSDTKVIILDSTKDGVAQITEILERQQGVKTIEIISHGSEGTVRLGKGVLSKDSLSEYSSQLQQWGEALSEKADILLYGCNVAADETGISFVRRLSQLTGADVAASQDLTGNSSLGGDWDLEVKTGDIESATAITSEAQETYTEVLPISVEYFDGTDTNDRTEFKQWKGRGEDNFQKKDYGTWNKPPYVSGKDHFGIRFTGYVYAHETGNYRFREGSDDGVRLWVNNKNIIDDWNRSGFNHNQSIVYLEAGKWYPIQMDYFEKDAGAAVELKWEPPSKSSPVDIPDNQLIPLASANKTGANDLGYGLKGEYFDYSNLSGSKFTQVDSAINFDWKGSSPKSSIDNDYFSVRWTGSVVIPESGYYRFSTETDDGVRLYINDSLVINDWKKGASQLKQSSSIYFNKGTAVPITLEYHEDRGDAYAKLFWEATEYPHSTKIISRTLIPATSLIPYSPQNRPYISVKGLEATEATEKAKFEITATGTIPPGGINVFYNLKGIDGASGNDFSDPNLGQIVLTPSNKTKIVEVDITNDLIKEQNEKLQLEILPGVQYRESTYYDSAQVNIEDNEPSLKITKLIDGVDEKEEQKDLFKIELLDSEGKKPQPNSQGNLTISLKLTGSATPTSDYKLYYTAYDNNKTLQSIKEFPNLKAGKTSYDITVPSGTEYITIQAKDINDAIFESEESITVEIEESNNNHYGVLRNKTATVNLIDNEPSLKLNKLDDKVEGEQKRIKDIFKLELLDSDGENFRSNQKELTISLELLGNAKRGSFTNTQAGSDYKLYYTAYGKEGEELKSRQPFPNPEINKTSYDITVPSGTEYITIQAEDINDEIFESLESITVEINKKEEYGVLEDKIASANLIDNEPIVSLGKVVHPAEGMGFGSTISGLESALVFSENKYIAVAENFKLNLSETGSFTQETWVFSNSKKTGKQGIIGYQTGEKSAYPSISIINEDSVEIGFGDGENWHSKTVNDVLNPNSWNHVATTFDGKDYKLYVNAVEVFSTSDFAGQAIAPTQQLEIGKAGNSLFEGAMDEVRVWNVARSAYEIQSSMVSQLEGNENGLVGYWNFNNNINNSVSESSTATDTDNEYIKNPAPQIGYVEVELDKPFQASQGLWVKYKSDGTATQNEDYFNSRYRKVSTDADTEVDGIIIPQGETKGRIYFSALSDTVVENDETIDVELIPHNFDDENQSSATNSNYGIDASSKDKTIAIKDNQADRKGVILLDEKDRAIDYRNPIVIRNNKAQFKVRLSSQPTDNVRLDLSSDRNGLDKTKLYFDSSNWNSPQTVTLNNISDRGKITVSADNYLGKNSEDFRFTIDPPLRVTEGSQTDIVPVTPEVSVVSQRNIKEDEGLAGQFILNLSAPSPKGGITIDYELGGSAVIGEDYQLATPTQGNKFSITILEGETQGSVPIFPIANDKSESNKDITLTLKKFNRELNTGYDDYTIAENNSQAELKILNDDVAGIEVVNAQIIEVEGETTTRYSDSLIPAVTNEPYPTVGDFVELKNEAGNVLATVPLTQEIIDTGIVNIPSTEEFPSDTTSLQANIVESRNNPDNLGFLLNNSNISLEDSTVKINLPGISDRSTVGIRLHSKPTADVTVALKDIDDTETSLNKTTLTFTAENWDSYQLVEISGKDDLELDGNIEYEITAEVTATEDSRYTGKSFSISVKNLDDDSELNSSSIPQTDIDPSLPLVRLGDRIEVAEDSNLVDVEVNLSQPATEDLKVVFDVSDDSATQNLDYSVAQQVFIEQTETDGTKRFDSPFDEQNLGKNSQPTFADLDNDGDLDAIVGTQAGINYYQNTGSANAATLQIAIENPFGDIEVTGATPSLGDLNGDGKLDLVFGKQDGTIDYFINTSSSDDDLRFQASNELNSFFRNPFSNIDVGNNANPFLIDFDGDGDLDLVVGSKGSRNQLNTLRYYQNTGSKVSPSFEEQPQHTITKIAAGINSSPFVVDWDLDGDLDILVTKKDGSVNFFAAENDTYATNPEQLIAASVSEKDRSSVDNILKDVIQDSIDKANEKDRFEIDLEAGIVYNFDLEGSPTGKGSLADTVLRLYDRDNNVVAFNDDNGESYNSRITYTPTTAGTFYVEAAAYGKNTGTYELSLPQENAAKFGITFADTDGDGDLDAFVGTPDGEIDYYQRFSLVEFAKGEQTKNIRLRIKDDSIAEEKESFQVNLVPNTGYEVDAAEVSLKLDGQNDYVEVPHRDHLNVKEQLTIEAEVYLDENTPSGNRRILQKGDNGDQYGLLIEDGQLKFDIAGVGSVTAPVFSGKQWHHIAGVYDGTQLKLYVDGEEVSSLAASGEIFTTTNNLNIGTKNASAPAGNFWKGEIKEVRIWSIARTENEIQASRDEILAGMSEELIAYYPGRTNSNNSVVDGSIYNQNGELTGDATSGNNISTTVAINDNDRANVTIRSLSDTNITSETGDNVSYGVKLDTQPTAPVTVYLGTQDETEGFVSVKENAKFSEVASLEFTPENWDREQTFYVKGIDDLIGDGDLPYQIITTVKSEDAQYQNLAVDDLALTNTDNDRVGLIVTGAAKAVEGRENVYSLKLQSQPKNEIRVIVTPTNDQIRLNDELIGEPYTLTFTPDNWNLDQTVRATALDDSVVEYLHTSEITFEIETGKSLDFESSADNSLLENAIALGTIEGSYKWTNLAISDADDVDWFEFDLADTGNKWDFARIDFDATRNLKLELYSAADLDNSIRVAESHDSEQNFEKISLDGLPFGKYYVKVSGSPNNYELLIADEDYQYVGAAPEPLPVIIEDNDLPTVNITAGETASELFGKPSYFTFQLDAPIPDNETEFKVNYRLIGGSATLNSSGKPGDYRMQTKGFVRIAPGDIQNNLIVVPIDDKLIEDLDLTVNEVKPGNNDNQLVLTVSTPLPLKKTAKSIGEGESQDLPADNNTSGVLVAGDSVIGNIGENGDRDRFKVKLEAGKEYIFDLEGSPTNSGTLRDTYLSLYNSNGDRVAANDDGGEGLNSRLTFTPQTAGEYHAEAGGYSDRTGSYKLTLTGETDSTIPDEISLSQGTEIKFAKGLVATVQGSPKLTKGSRFYEGNITLEVDPLRKNQIIKNSRGKVAEETVIVELLPGKGYKLPENTQATLRIKDDDVPGVRIVQIGENTVVEESETASFQVSLLSEPTQDVKIRLTPGAEIDFVEPINPTTVEVDKDVYSFDDTKSGILDVQLDSLVDTEQGKTVAFEINLQQEPSSDYTVELYDANNPDSEPEAVLTFTKVEENLITGERPGNWDRPQQVVIGNLDFDKSNKLSLKAVVKNQAGEEISQIDLPINHTIEQVEKQTTEITISPEEWFKLKTVPITGVDDGISEPGTYYKSNITYEVSSSDSDYNNIFVPQQRIDVTDPLLNPESTAQTLQQGLTGLQNSLDSLEVPLVGSLDGKSPKLIKNVSDKLVTAVSGEQNLSAIRLKEIIEEALKVIGLDFLHVSVDIDEDDINITLNIKKTYNLFSLPLDADLGLDALGIGFKSEGEIKSTFEMEVVLGFGLHKDFGFYMDTDETKVEAAIKLGLDKFKGQGNLNFLRLDLEDDLTNKTELEISLKAGLNDLDNYQTVKFFDVDGDGQLDSDIFTYPIKDQGSTEITKNREIREPFVEVSAKGKAQDFPTVGEASNEAKRVNWNGNNSFDEPKYEKNEGIYRTQESEYYFDLNRNGRLDNNNQEKLLSVTKEGNTQKKWFDKQGKIKPFRIEEKTKDNTKIYYFDKNGNNQPDENEKITKKEKAILDKNNNGKLDADINLAGEGKFVRGTGIAFADANNNKIFDVGEKYVHSQFDELTLENSNLALSFLDLNGDKQQTDNTSIFEGESNEVNLAEDLNEFLIREAIDEKTNDSFLYLDLTGDSEFSEEYIKDGSKNLNEPKLIKDAGANIFFFDLNGDEKQNSYQEPLINEVGNKDAFLDLDFNGDRNTIYEPVINQGKDYLSFQDGNKDDKQEKIVDYDRDGIKDNKDRLTNGAVQTGTYRNGSSFQYLDTTGDEYWTQEHQVIKEGSKNYLDINNDGKKDDGDREIIDVDLVKVKENADESLLYLDENNNNQRDDKELLLLDKFTGRLIKDLNDNSEVDDGEPAIDVRLVSTELKSIAIESTTINYSGNDPVLKNLNGKTINYFDESKDNEFTREYQVLTDDTNNNNYGQVIDENGNKEVDFSTNSSSNDPLIIFKDATIQEDKSLSLDVSQGFVKSSPYLDYNNNGEFDDEASERSPKEDRLIKNGNEYRIDRNNNGVADNNEPAIDIVEALDLDENKQFTADSDLVIVEKKQGETTLWFNDKDGDRTQDNNEPFVFNNITFLDLDRNQKLTLNEEKTPDDFIVEETYLDLNNNFINDPGEPQLKDDSWVINEDYVVTYEILQKDGKTFIDQFPEDSLNKNRKGTYQSSEDLDLNKTFNVSNFQAKLLGLSESGTYTAAKLLGLKEANGAIVDSEITFVDLENDGKLDISIDPLVKIVDGVRFVDLDRNGSVTLNDDEDPVELVSSPNNEFDTESLGGGEIVTLLDDGSRLTLKELQNFKNDKELKLSDLFGYEFAGTANLGLATKTSIEGDPAFPSIGFNLGVGLPLFNYGDQEQSVNNGLTIEFKDMKLDLGTFLTDFVSPIIETADDILSFTKPVVDLLNRDTKMFSYLDLEDSFNKDSRPGVSILDIGMTLAEGISEDTSDPRLKKIKESIPKTVKFVETVTKITELSASLKKLVASDKPIVLNFGDYNLSDFKAASDDPADVAAKAGSSQNKNTTTQTPDSDTKTPIEQAQEKATPEQKGTLDKLRNLEGLEIPILSNPITLVKLLLGESNVDLIKYDIPDLEFAFSKEQQFPLWTPPTIAGALELGFEAKTDFSLGYDTGGYEAWKKTDYEVARVYQLLDGFYLDDWDDDGSEKDELSAQANITAGLSASAVVAKAVLNGGIEGTLGFDIVDEGELQGKNDGKIRGSEIITRLDTPLKLFDFKGQLDAFLNGEIRLGLDAGLFEIMKTVWSKELGRITLAKFNVGANGVTFSSSISGSYINAATVFFDGNFNDVWDEGEPITFTNEYGQYDLEIGLDWDSNQDGTIDELDGQIISVGGYDTSSGLPAGKFIGLPDSTIITPLTSLQVPLVQSGLTGEEADTLIKQQLGLDLNFDLETFDSLNAIGQQKELGLDIYLAHISIQALFNQGRALLDGLQGNSANPNNLQIVQETFAKFLHNRADLISEAYDLGNAEAVTAFLSFLTTENDVALTSPQLATIAGFIAESDRILREVAEVGSSKSLLETLPALASVKRVIQSDVAQLIQQIASNAELIEDIVTNFDNTIYQNYVFADEDINAFGNRSVKVTAQKEIIDEADGTTEFLVELSQPAPNQGLTVLYSISGTATLEEDYQTTEEAKRTVYIAPGETNAKITVSISDDSVEETTENITINLQSVGEGYILDPLASVASLKITDNDESADLAAQKGKTLIGSLDDDALEGSAGEDRLDGGYGNDTLQGKEGNDFLQGSQGKDSILGGLDNDTLEGNFDDDTLEGNAGNDLLDGGAGNDLLTGNEGVDAIAGGTEDDTLEGNAGNDLLEGNSGDDLLRGGSDNDWLVGDTGNDILDGGSGDDVLNGGEDADVFFFDSLDDGFDNLIDFDPSQGDKIQISAAGFGVDNTDDFRFISGILDFKGQDLALIQNQDTTYSYFPNLDDIIEVIDRPTPLTNPDIPVKSDSNKLTSPQPSPTNTVENSELTILDDILQRGHIRLGISAVNSEFDLEFTRTLAAALFGDASKIETVDSNFFEAFNLVADGTVDLVSQRFTHTSQRDGELNIDFSPVYFYDSQGIIVRKDSGIENASNLQNRTIGVLAGSTSLDNLKNVLNSQGIEFTSRSFATVDEMIAAYDGGMVDAYSIDKALIIENLDDLFDPENHHLLDLELSKEPIALALPENDSQWADVVRWVNYVPIQAEEFGINSENIAEIVAANTDDNLNNDSSPKIRRFLGIEGKIGAALGLNNNFAVKIVEQVGNYSEIYDRHFSKLERDRNLLHEQGGLFYSLPFSGSAIDSELIDNDNRDLLAEVRSRGYLKLGLPEYSPGFATQQDNGEYVGFDVDFGKAIAAALFEDPSKVEVEIQSFQDSFANTANGVVDLSAMGITHNLVRDASMGIDFSPTSLYTGQGILVKKDSGIDILPSLNGRRVGTVEGTTSIQNLQDSLSEFATTIIPVTFASHNEMFAAYEKGEIDAITTDLPILSAQVSTFENPEEHQILDKVLSKEPLALITDENQSQWADVVKWVQYSLVQAEELNINSENIDEFIAVNTDDRADNDSNNYVRTFLGIEGNIGEALGLSPDFAVNVIKAVGNYGEIYERNLDSNAIPRGKNQLYTDFGLQYSLPFTSSSTTTGNIAGEDNDYNRDSSNHTERGSTVYRFFNPSAGVHFYTADKNESDYVRDNLKNYDYEGESYITVDPVTGNSPEKVYRFFNSITGGHLYTADENERNYIIDNLDNFTYEDVKFHAYETEVAGTIPVYRFYEPTIGVHFYTPSEAEKIAVEENLSNYTYEGIAYYAFPLNNF